MLLNETCAGRIVRSTRVALAGDWAGFFSGLGGILPGFREEARHDCCDPATT